MTEQNKPPLIGDDNFEEWCGSTQVKGCGKIKDMCEKTCRFLAQRDADLKWYKDRGYMSRDEFNQWLEDKGAVSWWGSRSLRLEET